MIASTRLNALGSCRSAVINSMLGALSLDATGEERRTGQDGHKVMLEMRLELPGEVKSRRFG